MSENAQQFVEETMSTSAWHMETLQAVAQLNLPDWAIGAGFVRNAVWDRLYGYPIPTPLADIDVLYFDRGNLDRYCEVEIEEALFKLLPDRPWSVRNQARMHVRNGDEEYQNTQDAISHWLETPTCVAVSFKSLNALHITAPFGLEDVMAMHVRPTPMGLKKYDQYLERIRMKNWAQKWPKVTCEGLARL